MRTPVLTIVAVEAMALPLAGQHATDSRPARPIPHITSDLRRMGVPRPAVDSLVAVVRANGLGDAEVAEVLEGEADAIRAGGAPEHLGHVVRGLVAGGLRGRELAHAIRVERARLGIGAGGARGKGRPPVRARGGKPGGA